MSNNPKNAPAPAPAPAPAAAPAEGEAAAPKVKKERKEKKPKANVQVWKLYKLEGEAATRLRKECPRCGKGYFMAEHKDRLSCGHCGFTTFKNK
ncbi:MAG: 30S ribosomal protein S27ae [Nitrososphaerota archaeon]|nr:30S ribosomal protein S27ae [Nitrososphaerota archaeon]